MLRARDLPVGWRGGPVLMGILNVNPDSFSDPGPRSLDALVDTAARLVADGATIVDVGAQSAITGRPPVAATEEADRLVPVVRRLVAELPGAVISVDSYKAVAVEAALVAGAHMVNDVSGLADPAVAELCARHRAALVVMHTSAPPLVRRQDPGLHADVAREVAGFLAQRAAAAIDLGVAPSSVVVDPGIDFAKTPAQSIELLRGIAQVAALGFPVLLALSRKDFVGAITGRDPAGRGAGTLGAIAALAGVQRQILRVHDVAATRDLLAVLGTLTGDDPVDPSLRLADHLRHQRPAG